MAGGQSAPWRGAVACGASYTHQGTPVSAAIGCVSVWRLVRRRRQTATPPLPGCQALVPHAGAGAPAYTPAEEHRAGGGSRPAGGEPGAAGWPARRKVGGTVVLPPAPTGSLAPPRPPSGKGCASGLRKNRPQATLASGRSEARLKVSAPGGMSDPLSHQGECQGQRAAVAGRAGGRWPNGGGASGALPGTAAVQAGLARWRGHAGACLGLCPQRHFSGQATTH